MIRNRIIEHVKVRARELTPHPFNFRRHPPTQRRALAASYEEVGFARSLLGFKLPDGKIQLIDGHLRAGFDPDMEVVVELLDVSEAEANALILTIDPLAALAQTDHEVHDKLCAIAKSDAPALNELWQATATDFRAVEETRQPEEAPPEPEKHIIVVECADEAEQLRLLRQFQTAGIQCKAVVS